MLKNDPHHAIYDPVDDGLTDFNLQRMIRFSSDDGEFYVAYVEYNGTSS